MKQRYTICRISEESFKALEPVWENNLSYKDVMQHAIPRFEMRDGVAQVSQAYIDAPYEIAIFEHP